MPNSGSGSAFNVGFRFHQYGRPRRTKNNLFIVTTTTTAMKKDLIFVVNGITVCGIEK